MSDIERGGHARRAPGAEGGLLRLTKAREEPLETRPVVVVGIDRERHRVGAAVDTLPIDEPDHPESLELSRLSPINQYLPSGTVNAGNVEHAPASAYRQRAFVSTVPAPAARPAERSQFRIDGPGRRDNTLSSRSPRAADNSKCSPETGTIQRRLAKLPKPFMVDGNSLNVATLAVAVDKS